MTVYYGDTPKHVICEAVDLIISAALKYTYKENHNMDMYGFYTGKMFDAYEFFGCHRCGGGWIFRTFAPAAARISVIGEFNGWNETPMHKIYDGNSWEAEIPNAKAGDMYKYRIYRRDGSFIDHCDPYGFGMELRPHNASIIRDLYDYSFDDSQWMRSRSDCRDKPLNIYELHLGSWKTNDEDENGWYTYSQLADLLIPYLKEMGYNYIEILPVSEHPCDNSWGYQITGFYSPTARYGTMNSLKEMIDKLHQNGIGVILDFVPVHFAVDDYALANYDGTALYEYPNSDVGNSEWGSRNFIHSRGEIQTFLQSNANYWIKEYHFDGLRMDAISNAIYWQGDAARGVNGNALRFIQNMNGWLKSTYPGIILAAEDSSAFNGITKPVDQGGLGFDYKWDMGWMNDTLNYFREDPDDRERDYHKLTFSMMYFYSERFLLPLSHDENVHGKATVLQKMNGQYEEKFPQARAMYMYMFAHTGKKLNFMGGEFGQLREWDEKREQDWDILTYPVHDAFKRFTAELNKIYLKYPALYADDYSPSGFLWTDCTGRDKCMYSFLRKGRGQTILAVFNFSDTDCGEYKIDLPGFKKATPLIFSNWEKYGGNIPEITEALEVDNGVLSVDAEAFSGKYFLVE